MKFFISKNKKLPPAAQKGLLPREEFMTKGKERFLAVYDASDLARNAQHARPAYVTAFFRVGIGVLAVLAIGVGLSAYADTANVAVTNPLYPLKRISENVRLALAPAAEKPQLQATFAVRRADEIAELQASSPSSTLIPQLTHDMEQDIDASLLASANATTTAAPIVPMEAGRSTAGPRKPVIGAGTTTVVSSTISAAAVVSSTVGTDTINIYCSAFEESTSGVLIGHLENELSMHPAALLQFNKQCGSQSDGNQNGPYRRSVGENTPTITATTTTTIVTAPPSLDVHAPSAPTPQTGL
jgi:hypothetical protein